MKAKSKCYKLSLFRNGVKNCLKFLANESELLNRTLFQERFPSADITMKFETILSSRSDDTDTHRYSRIESKITEGKQ